MVKPKKLGKTQKILLLPAMAIVFAVGWCMTIGGDRKSNKPKLQKAKQPQPKRNDNVTLMPAFFEEDKEEEILAR